MLNEKDTDTYYWSLFRKYRGKIKIPFPVITPRFIGSKEADKNRAELLKGIKELEKGKSHGR